MKLVKESILFKSVQKFGTLAIIILFSGGLSVASLELYVILAFVAGTFLLISSLVFWEYLVWKNYEFAFGEENLNIKHGVLQKKHREIPLSRIQNVDIQRNIFQRLIGIAKVNLETAGGNTTEASLKYVDLEKSREIQKIVRRLKKEDSPKEKEESDEKELLFELEGKELLLLGVTSINTRMIFGIFALIGISGSFMGAALENSGIGLTAGAILLAIIGVIVTWTGNIVTNLLKYFDFKLYQVEDSLEYERGLFNRSEGSIPLEKIQKLTIEENPLKRFSGYSTLKIETAGYSAEQSMQQGAEAAIPLANHRRTIEFAKMRENFQSLDLQSISDKAKRRYLGRYLIIVGIIFASGFVYNQFYSFNYWLILALVPIAEIAAHLKWKNKGYKVGEDYFTSMNGFWNRKTMIAPYYRIQNLIETQTILQRRWNLSSLTLDIAGTNSFQKDLIACDLDEKVTRKLKKEVFTRFKTSVQR